MTRKPTHRPFSLIELLAVIGILGFLTYLMLPKYGSFETTAKEAVSSYNDAALANFLPTYAAANGAYPSQLHTGLDANGNLLDNLPPIIMKHISADGKVETYNKGSIQGGFTVVGESTGGGPWEGSMKSAGILRLMYGKDSEITDKEVIGSSSNAKTPAIKVNGDFFNNTTGNTGKLDGNRPLRFGGTTLTDWVNAMPMAYYSSTSSGEGYNVFMFFLGKDVKWGVVYNKDGTVKNVSKASINLEKNVWDPNNTQFLYPAVFFKVFKTQPAELIGVVSFSKDGSSFAQYK